MVNILLVLLGSNIPRIINDRLEITLKFIEALGLNIIINDSNYNITWFLSGGKFDESKLSEAEIMKSHIEHYISNENYINFTNHNFVLDTKSTNIAKKFTNITNYINKIDNTPDKFDNIYITTSNFNYKNASTMLYLTDKKIFDRTKWILGNVDLEN